MNRVFITKKQVSQGSAGKKFFFSKAIKTIREKYRFSVVVGIWFLGIFFVFICIAIFLRLTIYKDEQVIYVVGFSKSAKRVYNDPMLYDSIYQYFRGKNKFFQKFLGAKGAKKFLQDEYPMVDSLVITDTKKPNRIDVDISFREPLFVIAYNDQRWGVWSDEKVYELKSGRELGSKAMVLWMPSYLTGSLVVGGLFSSLPAQELKERLDSIFQKVPEVMKVVYLIGGERIALIMNDGKKVYLNAKKDIKNQLDTFLLLQKNRFDVRSGVSYESIAEIDVSSLDYPIIKLK